MQDARRRAPAFPRGEETKEGAASSTFSCPRRVWPPQGGVTFGQKQGGFGQMEGQGLLVGSLDRRLHEGG